MSPFYVPDPITVKESEVDEPWLHAVMASPAMTAIITDKIIFFIKISLRKR